MNESKRLLTRIRWLVGLFIAGLVISGATAIPLDAEVRWLVRLTGAREVLAATDWCSWPDWAR